MTPLFFTCYKSHYNAISLIQFFVRNSCIREKNTWFDICNRNQGVSRVPEQKILASKVSWKQHISLLNDERFRKTAMTRRISYFHCWRCQTERRICKFTFVYRIVFNDMRVPYHSGEIVSLSAPRLAEFEIL